MPSLAQSADNAHAASPRDYARDPHVEAEVARLAPLSSQRLLTAFAAEGNPSSERVREETLVCLARAALRAGNDDLAWKILEVLGKRVAGKLLRMANLWRLSPSASEEINDEMLVAMYQQVLDLSAGAQFWEVRFWICFDRRFLSLMRRRRDEERRRAVPEEDHDTGTVLDPWDSLPDPASLGARLHNPATRTLLADALSQFPEPVRVAYLLKHWCGYPEESVDPANGETIASLMGVSGRTVRNYLTRAEQMLTQWRAGMGNGRRASNGTSGGAPWQ